MEFIDLSINCNHVEADFLNCLYFVIQMVLYGRH